MDDMTETEIEPPRRGRKKSDHQRVALIDAAEVLMRDEGYAAVTSRRVAKQAGVGHQLVHYYFRNMDELYLALIRRRAAANIARLRAALESDQPLRAMWTFSRDPNSIALGAELIALASHSPAVREEIVKYAEEYRRIEVDVLSRHLEQRGIKPRITPTQISVLFVGISGVLAREASLGFTMGHAEVEALIASALDAFETAPPT